jgi:tetrahydromethanopterin S-methyltransferase subunit E
MNNHSSHTKLILAAVAGFVVLAAFGVPVLSYLPLLAILAICPLMMVFMMRGMDHGGGSNRDDDSTDRTNTGHRH